MSRRTPVVATLTALPLLLGGCGIGTSIAGVHDAPAEQSDGASVSETTAKDVAQRVLDEATDARSASGTKAADEREQVLSGPALREVTAATKSKDELSRSAKGREDLQVLAVSRGSEWPRAVLATSLTDDVQHLHVFVAKEADQPFTLFADVPMAAGSSVPALAPIEEGTPVTLTDELKEKSVADGVQDWTKGVAYPAPKKTPSSVSFEDAFSTALKKNASAKNKDFKKLAKYTQKQSVASGETVSFELVEGGWITFVPMTRTDTVTATKKLKVLKIEDKALKHVLDSSRVKKSLSIKHAETIAFFTPESGKAKVVGVSDVLQSAKGR